ncbi:MAG: hypothetical protein ABS99_05800 [Acetobacteraceae bacterium SCN 69-10]|nr:MAG: hypothetical protein ABS99_05800 [Acetobacteraceae bacterium SCN 69-10]
MLYNAVLAYADFTIGGVTVQGLPFGLVTQVTCDLTLNPTYPYIVYNDLPKVAHLKRLFPERYRSEPVLVKRAQSR